MVLHIRQSCSSLPKAGQSLLPRDMQGLLRVNSAKKDLVGEWEIIRVQEPAYERQLEAGQILWGRRRTEREGVEPVHPNDFGKKDGTCKGQMTDNEWNIVQMNGKWSFLTENIY